MNARTLISLIATSFLLAGCSSSSSEKDNGKPDASAGGGTVATQPVGGPIPDSASTGVAARGLKTPASNPAPVPTTQPSTQGASGATGDDPLVKAAIDRIRNSDGRPISQADIDLVQKSILSEPPGGVPDLGAPELLAPRSSFVGYGAESYRLVSEKDEIVSCLKNGMVVIVKRISSPVVAVRGVALTGGIYEKQWLGGGLSHLLEHLVAGGSSERRTEAENKALLEKIGNNSNAYTTEDNTCFFINTTPIHMEQAVDLVTGWMLGAKITVPEYTREYQVVQRELEMGKGQPDRAFYYLEAMNRYRVSPARVPVIGYQEVIQRLSRDDVYAYYKMAYQPNNMVFVVAGDMEPETMLSAVEKNVAGAPPGRVFSHNIEDEPPVLTPRTLVCTFPKLGQARLMLGFPGVSMNSTDMSALDLLGTILGGGESSVLVEELRDKQQLVSAIGASDDTPSYVNGTFGIEMVLDPDKVQAATKEALKILDDVKKNGVDADRLVRAKMQMRAARVKGFQTAENIAASLGDDYRTTGDIHFSDLQVERYQKVTAEQIKAVANKYLDTEKLITTAMFPSEWAGSKGLPAAEDLLRPAGPTSQPTTQPAIASAVERVVLDNGTILLVKHVATSPTVVMSMYSLGGVLEEDEKTNGLGNLSMQMVMRGTKTRSAEQIAEFFDSTGGEMGATCGNNSWYWTASCLKDDFAKTIEVYADIVNNPAFAEAELTPFKKRVEAGIKSQDAEWSHQAIRFFKTEFYGPMNSPYQFLPEGTEKNIETFTDAQVRDWYETRILKSSKRVLAIYGDVDIAKAKQLAADLLGKRSAANLAPAKIGDATTTDTGGRGPKNVVPGPDHDTPSINVERVAVNKTEQDDIAGVVIGFKADPVVGGPDWYNFVMAKTLTGGYSYPTGYLFVTLRGLGLVYDAESQVSPGITPKYPGTFMVFAGCTPARVNEVVELSLQNIARLQGSENDIDPKWYKTSQELIPVADAMEHETAADQATTAATNELFGLGYNWQDEFREKIRSVKMSDVQSLARRRLRDCIVTISTPKPELVKVKTGERKYESFPTVDLTPRGVQHDTGAAAPK